MELFWSWYDNIYVKGINDNKKMYASVVDKGTDIWDRIGYVIYPTLVQTEIKAQTLNSR